LLWSENGKFDFGEIKNVGNIKDNISKVEDIDYLLDLLRIRE